ncbi:MAG: response regulator [Planctomycetaceae bacterium]|nr:response regulator [Polyangiaceae bacterium]NUN51998.1 response regulator [Planctomycetaceae bacterium]
MSPTRPKVLLVEDSEPTRRHLVPLLRERGFDVVAVDGAASFIRSMPMVNPDIVLMDLEMPGLDGTKLIEIARRSGVRLCPMVLFSARPEPDLARAALACKATGYICKTADGELLAREIRRFLG